MPSVIDFIIEMDKEHAEERQRIQEMIDEMYPTDEDFTFDLNLIHLLFKEETNKTTIEKFARYISNRVKERKLQERIPYQYVTDNARISIAYYLIREKVLQCDRLEILKVKSFLFSHSIIKNFPEQQEKE